MDLARGLKALGLNPGERVVISVAENRPEWLVADLAIMTAGGISVPAYTTNTTGDHLHILTDSGAAGAVVSTRALADRLRPAAEEARDCRWMVAMEDIGDTASDRLEVHGWDAVMASGQESDDSLESIIDSAGRGDTACFIYTSGTGGAPKGVMLSHGNIICNCMGAHDLLHTFGLSDEVFLSFLPLVSFLRAHRRAVLPDLHRRADLLRREHRQALEQSSGSAADLIMTAVPRLYETMHQRIRRGVEKQGGLKAKLFYKAEALGRKKIAAPGSLSLVERLLDALVERLVRGKGARALRRAPEGHGIGRGSPEPRYRHFLHRPGPADLPGLWPDRGGAGGLRQSARPYQAGDRRPAAEGRRGEDRRGRRDPGARRTGHAGLLAGPGGDGPGDPRRLAPHGRYRRAGPGRLSEDYRPQEGYRGAVPAATTCPPPGSSPS